MGLTQIRHNSHDAEKPAEFAVLGQGDRGDGFSTGWQSCLGCT